MVALKLMEGIYDKYWFEKGTIEELQDIASLWVVADVTPIEDENFYLVKESLQRFHISNNKGIKYFTKLLWNLEDTSKNWISTDLIWWRIAPRINAIGRMSKPTKSLYMLLNWNDRKIEQLYEDLEFANKTRQNLQEDALKDLVIDDSNKIIFVVLDNAKDWLLGLISWKVKEKYNKPTLCFVKTKDWYKWSWRSVWKVDILSIFNRVKHLSLGWGGHKAAMWCSVSFEKFEEFKNKFIEIWNTEIKDSDLVKSKTITGILDFTKLDLTFRNLIVKGFAPYGHPNNKPLFLLKWKIVSVSYLKDTHTKLVINDSFWATIEVLKWSEKLEVEIWDKINLIWEYQFSIFRDKLSDNIIMTDYYIE